jgi:tetratricopeptide (TPR) repeat protein
MKQIIKRYILVIFLLIQFKQFVYSQDGFFITNINGINNRIDSLPCFIYEKAELDTFLFNNQIMRPVEEEWGVNIYVNASFLLDTLGVPHDIKVIKINIRLNDETKIIKDTYADTVKRYYSKETARLIMLTQGLWNVDSKNSKNKLNILVSYKTEAYDDKNRDALRPNHNFKGKNVDFVPHNQGEVKTSKNIYKYYDFGVQKMAQNKTIIAKKYFEQALKVKANDLDALYNLGICYFKLKDNINACKSWRTGLSYGDSGVQELLDKYCK